MRIAVVAHLKYPIAEPYAGGLEMHTHLLVRTLQRRGHVVTLFASTGSDPELAPTMMCDPTGIAAEGDARHEAAIYDAEVVAYRAMMDMVRAGNFDLVHNNALDDLPLRASGGMSLPWVTVLHVPPFDSLVGGIVAAAPGMTFLAVSSSLARQWSETVPHAQVVGNGVDLTTFTYNATPDVPPHAIWSGRIVPEKGLHLAIDAARAAGLSLHFAGPRLDPAYWAAEIAPRLGWDLVDLGHLPHRELAQRIGLASVAIVTPRWEEPFGLVVAEALACGTPVAAFRRGAMPAILDVSCGRLGKPDDADDLGAAMREAMGLSRRDCRNRAEALFDAEAMADRYLEVYRQIVDDHTPRRTDDDLPLDHMKGNRAA
ncbi:MULTISPECIES: glycosyltransferase [unclassified Methylobacterium]|uniref:glycosyltransferase n=1 Tax=unclassified Methylobacterium TaxID=2615210 RepID=UPI0011C20169|nr:MULTISPECIES: glycosyltransferase [unclassified Methylobacterium]QEE39870.1 glycosyltransferase family 4 protein [Methylobacterium sp. WL1]TXN55965.1 glycosyltransferase family 4 protein [Methylobacterium sp. WL2]